MKIILVGDPEQLPPCVLSNAGNTYGLSQSLYSRLYSAFEYSDGPISMLDPQYRLHSHICHFPSERFYSNRLITDDSVDERMKHFSLKPLFLYNLTRSPHIRDDAGSSSNAGEAKLIQYFCNLLISHLAHQPTKADSDTDDDDTAHSSIISSSNPTSDSDEEEEGEEIPRLRPIANDDPRSIAVQQRIAVITPYKAQVRCLRSCLPPYIEVMTVDSSQGKEKDIVIVSCVRSGGTIGFLDDMNRVNVLLTRSKYALYIVGNLDQLATQHNTWRDLVRHARLRKVICDVGSSPVELPYRK
jgi:superfamily I DNA and/or RNA helicase